MFESPWRGFCAGELAGGRCGGGGNGTERNGTAGGGNRTERNGGRREQNGEKGMERGKGKGTERNGTAGETGMRERNGTGRRGRSGTVGGKYFLLSYLLFVICLCLFALDFYDSLCILCIYLYYLAYFMNYMHLFS